MNIGNVLAEMNDPRGALLHQQKALAMIKSLSAEDPKNMQLRQNHAGVLGNIGLPLTTTGDEDGAVRALQEALTLLGSLPAADLVWSYVSPSPKISTGWERLSPRRRKNQGIQLPAKNAGEQLDCGLRRACRFSPICAIRKIATGSDAAMPDEVMREISKCYKALLQ
jgi:hypothetical protein